MSGHVKCQGEGRGQGGRNRNPNKDKGKQIDEETKPQREKTSEILLKLLLRNCSCPVSRVSTDLNSDVLQFMLLLSTECLAGAPSALCPGPKCQLEEDVWLLGAASLSPACSCEAASIHPWACRVCKRNK